MYGNTEKNANRKLTSDELDTLIFGEKMSEYGFSHFQDPHTQTYFEHVEEEYRLRYKVREAYDGQELLRRMRTDMKREYLTRKKQVTTLQKNAAVTFRNAESKLQEYYSETTAAKLPTYRRSIDINAPLVTVVELPHDRLFDLKEYNPEKYFEGLRDLHTELRDSARSQIYDRVEKVSTQEEELYRQQQQSSSVNINDDKDRFSDCGNVGCQVCGWRCQEYEERKQQRECDDSHVDGELVDKEDPREITWDKWAASGHCLGDGDLGCSDCYSYGDDTPCAEFGHYSHEDEEAWVAEAEDAERKRRWEEMSPRESDRLWFENTRDVNDPWSDDDRSDDHNDHNNNDNDHNNNDATEAVTIPEVTAPGKGGVLCAKKKAVAAAGAAKARREKQQRKKKAAAKFVPVKITMNTNRENAAAAAEVLYTGRAQVNLPKKRNLNQVVARTEDEARKFKKRDAAKWKRLSTDLKQTAARGTKVATLPDPRPWYNNENHCEYDSDDF